MDRLTQRTVFHDIHLKHEEIENSSSSKDDESKSVLEVEHLAPQISATGSDDEWDTDLEDEGYQTRMQNQIEHVRHVYIAACRRKNIVPVHCFIKGLESDVINLNFQGLGPVGTRAVATALVIDRYTKTLLLAGNYIGSEGVRYVTDMLRENEFLTHVDLSENNLQSSAAEMIADLFRDNYTLTSLNLSGNLFKEDDAKYFAAILASDRYVGLKRLDLSHNRLGDNGAKVIAHALGDNEIITYLNLSWNQIRHNGIECLAHALAENNCLKVFDVSANGVSNPGAECIAKALSSNRTLEELNLSFNRIGLEGLVVLFKNLVLNDSLKTIKLSNNPITLQGPVAALKLLQSSDSTVLEKIEIADACVPRDFYTVLEEVQETHPRLKVQIGGYINARDMFKAESKSNQKAWMKDPVLVFINFMEDRKMKVVDIFKLLDKDKSCALSREEFKTGLVKIGCPLTESDIEKFLNVLDIDHSGEIDLGEFIDGFHKHKRRLTKYLLHDMTSSSIESSRTSSANLNTSSDVMRSGDATTKSRAHEDKTNTFLEQPRPTTSLQASYSVTDSARTLALRVPKNLTIA